MNAMRDFEDNSTLINRIKLLHPEQNDTEGLSSNDDNLKIGIANPLGSTMFKPIFHKLYSFDPELRYHMLSDSNEVILDLLSLGDIDLGIVPYFEKERVWNPFRSYVMRCCCWGPRTITFRIVDSWIT